MAKSESPITDLRNRLRGLLTNWENEISAVMQAVENQVNDLTELRQRIRDRDVALDHVKEKSKEKDARIAELAAEQKKSLARVEELEKKLGTLDKPAGGQKDSPHAEVEAMRAELAARKSLVKTLRADAQRGKALEEEVAQNREIIETMKNAIEQHTKTISELRMNSNSWERKYRRLADAGNDESTRDEGKFTDSDIFLTETAVGMFLDDSVEVDGSNTVVIDMTEPLQEARDERLRKNKNG